MRPLAIASLLLTAACAAQGVASCPESSAWPVSPKSLSRRVDIGDIPREVMNSRTFTDLAGAPKEAMQGWIDGQVALLKAKLQPGDQVWFYREEKCDRCGWYREGYIVVRGCSAVAELTTSDEM
jgi:hypothetical protein